MSRPIVGMIVHWCAERVDEEPALPEQLEPQLSRDGETLYTESLEVVGVVPDGGPGRLILCSEGDGKIYSEPIKGGFLVECPTNYESQKCELCDEWLADIKHRRGRFLAQRECGEREEGEQEDPAQ